MTALAQENAQVLNLIQAMLGAISPNMRRVALQMADDGGVHLRFLLAKDDEDDREEIDDIVFEFEALQSRNVRVEVSILVGDQPLSEIDLPGRLVFGRRE